MMDQKEKIMAPRPLDILCGRGRASHFYSGNVFFRSVIACHLPKYSSNTSKSEKADVVISVIQECFRQRCRFIKKNPEIGGWKELSLPEIKLKVGHALRDACADMTKSLEAMKNPKSELSDKLMTRAKLLEPRRLEPDECDMIKFAKQQHNSRRGTRRTKQPNTKYLAPPAFDELPEAPFVPSTEQTGWDLQQVLSAGPADLATAVITEPQQALENGPSPLLSHAAEEIKSMPGEQKQDISFPHLLEAMSKMSPETQRQVHLLEANGDAFATLLTMMSDARALADCNACHFSDGS